MTDRLPATFDVVVVGTGITESVVAAAVARIGRSVLHIDPREYYGGKWATFNWNEWLAGTFSNFPSSIKQGKDSELSNVIGSFSTPSGASGHLSWKNDVRDLENVWYDSSKCEEIKSQHRKFNIDTIPKVLMAKEEIIQLLIQSNVSRYLEFVPINRLLSSLPPPDAGVIEAIPLSRSDIFTTSTLSLVDKRKLMKFLEFVLATEEALPNTELEFRHTFSELVQKYNLSPKVTHFLQSAVRTMDDCLQMTEDRNGKDEFNVKFTENCRLFLQSINRYGNQTPFLWTLYGLSEICQSFCRLCAIYGGTYILKCSIESVNQDQDEPEIVRITTHGMEIRSKYLVLCPEIKFDGERSRSPKCIEGITLVRGVLLVTGPRLKDSTESNLQGQGSTQRKLGIYRLSDVDVIELDDTSLATPKDFRLLQVTVPYRKENQTPRQIIESRLSPYLSFQREETGEHSETRQRVIHGSYFLVDFFDYIKDEEVDLPCVFSCNVGSTELKHHVKKARELFHQMFPEAEFLPKAPNPEDIEMEDRNDYDDVDGEVGIADLPPFQPEEPPYPTHNGFPPLNDP